MIFTAFVLILNIFNCLASFPMSNWQLFLVSDYPHMANKAWQSTQSLESTELSFNILKSGGVTWVYTLISSFVSSICWSSSEWKVWRTLFLVQTSVRRIRLKKPWKIKSSQKSLKTCTVYKLAFMLCRAILLTVLNSIWRIIMVSVEIVSAGGEVLLKSFGRGVSLGHPYHLLDHDQLDFVTRF